jgi:hypothetical protein
MKTKSSKQLDRKNMQLRGEKFWFGRCDGVSSFVFCTVSTSVVGRNSDLSLMK